VVALRSEHGLSERRACAAVNLRRSVYRYCCQPNRDGELVELLLQLAINDRKKDFQSCSSDCDDKAGVGITNASIACLAV
jgi:hypothetical protein